MSWHPGYGVPDPSKAWYSAQELDDLRRAEQEREAFAAMIKHRARFELAAMEAEKAQGRELSPDEYRSLWDSLR